MKHKTTRSPDRRLPFGLVPLLMISLLVASPRAQDPARVHGKLPKTLEIADVMVVRGDGAPPFGPTSVYVSDGKIVDSLADKAEVVIDGKGKWLLPGLVATHAHLQEESAGIPMPMEYQTDLWTACGITTVRDLGSTLSRSLRVRARADKGEIAAPHILLYHQFGTVNSPADARARVRALEEAGADGIKFWSNLNYPPEILRAALDEAKNVGLRSTAHIGVGECNAIHYAQYGITSIEHWYGIPDAALRGVQDFPAKFSYSNEVDRFREAGKLWRQTDPQKLESVLQYLVDHNVGWSPTFAVYEASRDLVRAQNQPWFRDWLHPALEAFFSPNLTSHGSYFIGWLSTDEANWRENYRIWMQAVRRFEELGGVVTTGEDAGYIYLLYGFGLLRELELHEEAGFHPLEVIRHATYNGAKVMGMEDRFGRVLPGLDADLIVVNGNPLENLKRLYPTGCDEYVDGKPAPTGGVLWTIRGGRIWHGPTLATAIKDIVRQAREKAIPKR
ncbi:MAG: amidohydrolase family protein [Planctomycetota bacterium]